MTNNYGYQILSLILMSCCVIALMLINSNLSEINQRYNQVTEINAYEDSTGVVNGTSKYDTSFLTGGNIIDNIDSSFNGH